jgi:hypothetical protein
MSVSHFKIAISNESEVDSLLRFYVKTIGFSILSHDKELKQYILSSANLVSTGNVPALIAICMATTGSPFLGQNFHLFLENIKVI